MEYEADSFNRLVIGIMEKEKCSPEAALAKLTSLKILLTAGDKIKTSLPLQAAFLTAINTAKRAFLGGVAIYLPEVGLPCLLPCPENLSFNEVAVKLCGEQLIGEEVEFDFTLQFGRDEPIAQDSLAIVANSWQGGVLAEKSDFQLAEDNYRLPLGGIFAGGLGVGLAFLSVTGIHRSAADKSKGVSLWRPDLKWDAPEAIGPAIESLPKKYWLLGLGHLGQAYLWNIGMLPYADHQTVDILLQDFDKVSEANNSAGLLCEADFVGIKKTRMCAEWLERFKFETTVCERKFDANSQVAGEEPRVALCGFDSARSRALLQGAGFDLVVEASLGGKLHTFDNIILHTFPDATLSPDVIWGTSNDEPEINEAVLAALQTDKETCGIVPLTIAGKAVSSSFVGACAGALVIAELLRGLHGGNRYEKIVLQLRVPEQKKAVLHPNHQYGIEMAVNGYVNI
jgi:hypothetical protein